MIQQQLIQRYAKRGFHLSFLRNVGLAECVDEAKEGLFALITKDEMNAEFSVMEDLRGNKIVQVCLANEKKHQKHKYNWPLDENNPTRLYDTLNCVPDNVDLFQEFV